MPEVLGPGHAPALDPEAVARLRRLGGDSLTGKMASLFLDLAPRRLDAARKGLAAGDRDEVRQAAHSLKSSAGNIGAYALVESAGRLEDAAEEAASQEALTLLLEGVVSAWRWVRPEVEALIQEGSRP